MSELQTPPAIQHLVEVAREQAELMECNWRLESSDRSESRYFYIFRGEYWYGFRFASHEPFYRCSADYQQILLPSDADGEVLAHAAAFTRIAVRSDGHVVGDPYEVLAAIESQEQAAKLKHVSAHEASDLRHRYNHRARWAYEIAHQLYDPT